MVPTAFLYQLHHLPAHKTTKRIPRIPEFLRIPQHQTTLKMRPAAKSAAWEDIFHSPNVAQTDYSHLGYGHAAFQELPAQDKFLYDRSNLVR